MCWSAPLISTEGAIAAVIALLAGESLSPGVGIALAIASIGVCLVSVPPEEGSERRSEHHLVAVAFAGGGGLRVSARACTPPAGPPRCCPSAWVVLSARVIGTVALAIPLALAGRLRLTRRALPLVVVAGICEVLGFYSYSAGARGRDRRGLGALVAVLDAGARSAPTCCSASGSAASSWSGLISVVVGVSLLSVLRA